MNLSVSDDMPLAHRAKCGQAKCSTVVLTFNSERTIGATLDSVRAVSDDIHVVDSYSTDGTLDIVADFGANVVQRAFVNYGDQRNWAIDNLPLRYDWELHLDADELLTDDVAGEIAAILKAPPENADGFYIPRLTRFMGRPIRHGGMFPIYHLRLFRRGAGRCESRRYDQHFFTSGQKRRLTHPMIDDIRMDVGEFFGRHVRWAVAEAEEVVMPGRDGRIAGRLSRDPVEWKRSLRGAYYQMPLFFRAFGLFCYRYLFRGGFLDGKEGLVFFLLQTLAYRLLVDAVIVEKRAQSCAAD